MISDADVLPYLPRPPTKGYLRLRPALPHHSSIVSCSLAKAAHTVRGSPSSLWEVVRKYHCPRACHRARPATAGSKSTLAALAFAVVAPPLMPLAFYSRTGKVLKYRIFSFQSPPEGESLSFISPDINRAKPDAL